MGEKHTSLELSIIDFLKNHPGSSSKEIHDYRPDLGSYASVKRVIQALLGKQVVELTGRGKSTRYKLKPLHTFLMPVEVDAYFEKEIDDRVILPMFNFDLLIELTKIESIFTSDEQINLNKLQVRFTTHVAALTPEQYHTEFERLAIDLSWKSSQIEGNTYSLLETERLLKDQETAAGKTKDEATMLLNHKAALDFILGHPDYTYPLTVNRIEDIHTMLVRDLPIARNIRQRRVGISGTNYRPIDNEYQIREALEDMCRLINKRHNIFEKALLALVILSYIQPFEDGNKRTARILSNAILMNHQHCPLSFRTVDAVDYKKAMLIFYEQNNISAFKQLFIEQYAFAVDKYF